MKTRYKWLFLAHGVCLLVSLKFLWAYLSLSYAGGRPAHPLPNLNLQTDSSRLSRILYISCNRQNMHNPFWSLLEQAQPNGLLWMGDNIYADVVGTQAQVFFMVVKRFFTNPISTYNSVFRRTEHVFPHAQPDVIEKGYAQVHADPGYQKLLASPSLSFVTGVWDDHDYGVNDGDKTYIHKDESKKMLLDFLRVPKHDERYSLDHPGVYGTQKYTVYKSDKKKHEIAFIMLDIRYNKDSWKDKSGDFLGAHQWKWLINQLNTTTADVNFIVSSIQVLPEGRFTESWNGFPEARKKLLDTIAHSKARNVVFLSGDVHMAEISTYNHTYGPHSNDSVQLWEFTSSGLTHATRRTPYGFGFVLDFFVRWLLPTKQTWVTPAGYKAMYTGKNAGVLDISFENSRWIHKHQLINSRGEIVFSKTLSFRELDGQ